MKNLSRWANRNPVPARIIITLAHIFLVANAFWAGFLSYVADYRIAEWPVFVLGSIFFLAYFLYPSRNQPKFLLSYSYARQKACDFTLVLTYSLIITVGFNHFAFERNLDLGATRPQFIVEKIKTTPQSPSAKKQRRSLKKAVKAAKRNIKTKLKEIKSLIKNRPQGTHSPFTALLILFTITIAISLLYVVAGLSCELSCSGQEGLAWVVLILGALAVIGLTVLVIRAILRKTRKPEEV